MKKENKNYKECLEMMEEFVGSFAELDLMEYFDERQHVDLGGALALRIADLGADEAWRGTAKYLGRCLAVMVWEAEEGGVEDEEVERMARELVAFLPDGWTQEDVAGLWERAIDEASKRVPPMRKAYALGNQTVMAAMA